MQLKQLILLLQRPRILRYDRRQVIVPALSTLLAGTPRLGVLLSKFIRNLGPVFDSVDRNQELDRLVLLTMR